jgi:hypothetical protein
MIFSFIKVTMLNPMPTKPGLVRGASVSVLAFPVGGRKMKSLHSALQRVGGSSLGEVNCLVIRIII